MEKGGDMMLKKRILTATIVATLICVILASYFIYTTVASVLTPSFFVSKLVVMSKPMPPGTFEISIIGDAYGFYSFLEMFHHFSVNRLEWSTSLPTYPIGTFINFAVNVGSLDFENTNLWTYHLSVKGLDESSIKQNGAAMFSVQCKSGELDFVFSDSYHKVDITGMLKGDVHFVMNLSPDINFNYQGQELTINVHIGMRARMS